MKLYQAKVIWFYQEKQLTNYFIIAGSSLSTTLSELSIYYGEDNIDSVEITLLNPDHPYIQIPEDCYNTILEEGEY